MHRVDEVLPGTRAKVPVFRAHIERIVLPVRDLSRLEELDPVEGLRLVPVNSANPRLARVVERMNALLHQRGDVRHHPNVSLREPLDRWRLENAGQFRGWVFGLGTLLPKCIQLGLVADGPFDVAALHGIPHG